MTLTPEQKVKIRQKEASLDNALKRNTLTDYREGYFFVTLNTRNESPILCSVVGRIDAEDGDMDAPRCIYSSLGEKVMEMWNTIPDYHPNVDIIAAEVMPEHFHGLLYLKPENKKHLGHIVGGFMSGCTHAYWDLLGIDWRSNRNDNGVAALYPDRDRDHTQSFRGPALFVRGYNDVEAMNDQEVQIKIQYIREQARRRLMKGMLNDRYRLNRGCVSSNWNMDAVRRGLTMDRYLATDTNAYQCAINKILQRLRSTGACPASLSLRHTDMPSTTLLLDYVGDRDLLAVPKKMPLICHRTDIGSFEEQKQAVLKAARDGAVIVSAFISPKEKEIKRLLLAELLPIIEIVDKGFSDKYKPYGTAFYGVGEKRMVQITPWIYEYKRDAKISREMCMVMNELVRIVSRKTEDWWKQINIENNGIGQ